MPKLVLVRHGQSEWNEKNLFTGWVDVRLSETGQKEAKRAGELLKEAGINVDVLHTSKLSRAIQTANIALDAADQLYVPVKRSWRLNERHYGALQGKDKAQTLEAYGQEKFQIWRRSFDVPPPKIDPKDEYSQVGDRALVKHLDNISDEDIAGLNIPTGIPLVYELDENLKPTKPSYYLDPEAAAAGAAAVAAQGQKK